MGLELNIDYKKAIFTRSDGVHVEFILALISPTDLNENFLVLAIQQIETPEEIRLFYWIDKKRWTLNEFRFFALNNNMCLQITDKNGTVLASYGNCSDQPRLHDFPYGGNYN